MASVPTNLLSIRNLIWFAAWGVSLFGILRVHFIEGQWDHALCGAWGCGPPLAALISYHGFWLLFLLPLTVLLSGQLLPANSRRIGIVVFTMATAAIIVVVVADAISSSQHATDQSYLIQRGLFRMATYVDFPLIQLGIAGLILWYFGIRKNSMTDSAATPDPL
jgi:hypothetical protein